MGQIVKAIVKNDNVKMNIVTRFRLGITQGEYAIYTRESDFEEHPYRIYLARLKKEEKFMDLEKLDKNDSPYLQKIVGEFFDIKEESELLRQYGYQFWGYDGLNESIILVHGEQPIDLDHVKYQVLFNNPKLTFKTYQPVTQKKEKSVWLIPIILLVLAWTALCLVFIIKR